jgi:hypothetical protein
MCLVTLYMCPPTPEPLYIIQATPKPLYLIQAAHMCPPTPKPLYIIQATPKPLYIIQATHMCPLTLYTCPPTLYIIQATYPSLGLLFKISGILRVMLFLAALYHACLFTTRCTPLFIQRVVCFSRLFSCAVCIMDTVGVAGLSQMNSISGTGQPSFFFSLQ